MTDYIGGKPTRWIRPRESNGAVPVNIQDQTTPAFDLYFTQAQGTQTTTTVAGAIGNTSITVADPTAFAANQYFGLFNPIGRYYFGICVGVLGNVITIDTPLDFAFPIGSNVVRLTRNLNVVGTLGAPSVFEIRGPQPAGIEIDVTRFMLSILTLTTPDLGDFGDIGRLTNGLVLRKSDTEYRNIWNIKDNLELGLHAYDLTLLSAIGGGQDGVLSRYTFSGQDKHGVTVRLGTNESLELVIQDDLSGLQQFRCLAEGHEVTE